MKAGGTARAPDVTDLGGRAGRSGLLMLASSALQSLVAIGTILILVRVLTPAEFGLVAMATAVTGLAAVVRDFGVPHATVHAPELGAAPLSSLFWLNARLSVGLALVTAATAPLAAWFFGRPEVAWIVCVLTLGTLSAGLANVHMGLLRRNLRFGRIAVVELAGVGAGAVAGISSALLGAGYWALVAQQVTAGVATGAGLWVSGGWRPGRPRTGGRGEDAGLRSIRAYGRDVTWTTLLNQLAREFHGFLIGRSAGAGALGIYNAALRWALLPVRQIHLPLLGVAVSTFSRLQSQPERYRAYFRTLVAAFHVVVVPVTTVLFLTAEDVVLVLLGDPWAEAVPLFRILVWGALAYSTNRIVKWCYLSEGRTREQLQWNAVTAIVVILALAIGLRGGTTGVAWAYTLAMGVLALPTFAWCARRSPLRIGDFLAPAVPAVTAAVAGAVVLTLLPPISLAQTPRALRLAIRLGVFGLTAGLVVLATPTGRSLWVLGRRTLRGGFRP